MMISPAKHGRPQSASTDAGPLLASRLKDTRRAVDFARSGILVCLAAASFLASSGLMAVVDYFAVAPFAVRAAWLVVAGLATLLSAVMAWRTWSRGFRVRDAAAVMERGRAVLGQRFRTFLDYDDPIANPALASPALVSAMTRQAHALVTNEDFEQVVRQQPLGRSIALLCVVVAVWGLGMMAGPECRTAAGRTFLAPWHYTQVEVDPLESTVLEGSDVAVRINIVGRPIRAGFLRYQSHEDKGGWTTLAFQHTPASDESATPDEPLSGAYTLVIEDCRESLDFEVHAGPRDLPTGSVRVVQPLRVEKFVAHIEPPAYTAMPPSDSDAAQFKVQEGSHVSFELQLNRHPAETRAQPYAASEEDIDDKIAIQLRTDDDTIYGEMADVRKAITFDVRAATSDGMHLEPYRVQIRVQPDAKPSVRFVKPAEELEVLATAEVPLVIEAGDDLGLHKVGIGFQVAGGTMQTLWEHDYSGHSVNIQRHEVLALEDHDVRFPGSINYFAFAEDDYFGAPRRSVTPLRFVDIRPFKREYQLLDNGGT